MSQRSFDRLEPEQQEALVAAGQKARTFAYEESQKLEERLIQTFEDNGVEVNEMSKEQWQQWIDLAEETAYADFVNEVEGGQELIDLARQVQ